VATAVELIAALGLARHPEGGWYRRTWTHPSADADGRPLASSIHYLLEAGDRSHWHRIDATETWLWHGGGPLHLSIAADGGTVEDVVLGPDVAAGQLLQATVPPGAWQSAAPVGAAEYALVSCVVVPAFTFDHFELAPPDWSPPGR
jgi:predicted cupin superfamily sugar epimerase